MVAPGTTGGAILNGAGHTANAGMFAANAPSIPETIYNDVASTGVGVQSGEAGSGLADLTQAYTRPARGAMTMINNVGSYLGFPGMAASAVTTPLAPVYESAPATAQSLGNVPGFKQLDRGLTSLAKSGNKRSLSWANSKNPVVSFAGHMGHSLLNDWIAPHSLAKPAAPVPAPAATPPAPKAIGVTPASSAPAIASSSQTSPASQASPTPPKPPTPPQSGSTNLGQAASGGTIGLKHTPPALPATRAFASHSKFQRPV